MKELIGAGVYTQAEASRLLDIGAARLGRWLRGHARDGAQYEPLWTPQFSLGDDRLFLGFRDLMEARIASLFIAQGISPQRVRSAIHLARDVLSDSHPLSSNRFRTDGRDIFLRITNRDTTGEEKELLLNLFRRQYEFHQIIDPFLRAVDFDDHGAPLRWWPRGRQSGVVLDPARAFGQPIDDATSVPTAVLAAAGRRFGDAMAARIYDVPIASVRRAVSFERSVPARLAA